MKVFKFGGASVKDAPAVKNVASIIKMFPDDKQTIVISSNGKNHQQTGADFKRFVGW